MPLMNAGTLPAQREKAPWSGRDKTDENLLALEAASPTPAYTPTSGLAAALAGNFEPLVVPVQIPAVYDIDDVVTALVSLGFITVAP